MPEAWNGLPPWAADLEAGRQVGRVQPAHCLHFTAAAAETGRGQRAAGRCCWPCHPQPAQPAPPRWRARSGCPCRQAGRLKALTWWKRDAWRPAGGAPHNPLVVHHTTAATKQRPSPAGVCGGDVRIVKPGESANHRHAVAAGGQEAGLLLQHLRLAQLLPKIINRPAVGSAKPA